jgi:hypothetical protein
MEKTIIKFTLTGTAVALVLFALVLVDMAFLIPGVVVLTGTVVTAVVWLLVDVVRDPLTMGTSASPYVDAAAMMSAMNSRSM